MVTAILSSIRTAEWGAWEWWVGGIYFGFINNFPIIYADYFQFIFSFGLQSMFWLFIQLKCKITLSWKLSTYWKRAILKLSEPHPKWGGVWKFFIILFEKWLTAKYWLSTLYCAKQEQNIFPFMAVYCLLILSR